MRHLPAEVVDLLNSALVAELTVFDQNDLPVTYPLIPLFDGEKIFMTSSILFSKKLGHIKANPKVAISITDPNALGDGPVRCVTIQGLAQVIEDDLHSGWTGLLTYWAAKEPAIEKFAKQRYAMPLFWERSVIEIAPVTSTVWRWGSDSPEVIEIENSISRGRR